MIVARSKILLRNHIGMLIVSNIFNLSLFSEIEKPTVGRWIWWTNLVKVRYIYIYMSCLVWNGVKAFKWSYFIKACLANITPFVKLLKLLIPKASKISLSYGIFWISYYRKLLYDISPDNITDWKLKYAVLPLYHTITSLLIFIFMRKFGGNY